MLIWSLLPKVRAAGLGLLANAGLLEADELKLKTLGDDDPNAVLVVTAALEAAEDAPNTNPVEEEEEEDEPNAGDLVVAQPEPNTGVLLMVELTGLDSKVDDDDNDDVNPKVATELNRLLAELPEDENAVFAVKPKGDGAVEPN